MDYIKISISIPRDAGAARGGGAGDDMSDNAGDIKDILIARLSEAGYEGFEEEEGAAGDGMGSLHAYIPENGYDAGLLNGLLSPWQLNARQERLPERNWNEEWEKNFEPVVVDGFCGIRAFFHPPATGVEYDLIITPKMSFGTGHHATTYMMLSAMRQLGFNDQPVLDFGTGTGVLAILAEKLGASDVLAIDHDDWCIENAKENIRENNCSHIVVEKMEAIPRNKLFFIILANINKNIILDQLDAMGQHLASGGVILLSGLLQQDIEEIENKAARIELTISDRMTKNNWLCLKLERPRSK
jgi:ribosomal protein L11 methyltransferase